MQVRRLDAIKLPGQFSSQACHCHARDADMCGAYVHKRAPPEQLHAHGVQASVVCCRRSGKQMWADSHRQLEAGKCGAASRMGRQM